MILKKGDKYKIIYISVDGSQIEIKYKNMTIWFSTNSDNEYFVEHYKNYFYEYNIGLRKEKLYKVNKLE